MKTLFNLKSFFQFLRKNKTYTFIDIFGLSVSLMFVILIASYTIQELSTDKFQTKRDDIYVLTNQDNYGTAYRVGDRLKDRYPEIESICGMTHSNRLGEILMPLAATGQQVKASVLWTDSTFFNFFDFELVQGNKETILEAKNYAVISESFARKAFPGIDPIGQPVKINPTEYGIVNGVMKDIKNSVIPYADILARFENSDFNGNSMMSDQYWSAGAAYLFVKTYPNVDLTTKNDDLFEYFKSFFWVYERGLWTHAEFLPFNKAYFFNNNETGLLKGDWTFVIILISVGLVILVFAIINYVNLTVAQTGFRAKEMATRRLMGSSREELFSRMIIEATILAFISLGIGILLSFLFLPYANNLLETQINLPAMLTPVNVIVTILMTLLIGFIAGFLPAVVISKAKPVDVVKGTFRTQTKMVFSKFFITFQNVITVTLIAVSLTMILQIDHLITAPLGYKTDNMIHVPVEDLENSRIQTLANEFNQLAGVKRIGYSNSTPLDGGGNRTYRYNGNSIGFQVFVSDPNFVDMLDIKIRRDNQLGHSDGYYISQQGLTEMGEEDDIPSVIFTWGPGDELITFAGVIEDFYLHNRTSNIRPVLLQVKKVDEYSWFDHLMVEIEGDHKAIFNQLKDKYESLTDFEFPGQFVDERIAQTFAAQLRISRIITVFTFIAVLISLLGLLAMSTYFIQQRSREVAVRKVFGSSNMQVLVKLVTVFLNYVFVGFLIAVPIIWYSMSRWLSGYTYRISLSPGIFLMAGLTCLLISFITVYWQSRRAANMNPVESIKAE